MKLINDRCCALDQHGNRCRRPATRTENFHGDPEARDWPHENHPSWVRVRLCDKHWEGPWRKEEKP